MTPRRAPHPGQLSLFGPAVAVVTPVPAPRGPEPASPAADLILPRGPIDGSNRQWFCIRDASGAPRDALAILYGGARDKEGRPTSVVCPALGRRWEADADYCGRCLFPFYRAALAFAADLLGLPPAAVRALSYVTTAWRGETRALLRDVPHRGHVAPTEAGRVAA